MFSWNKYWIEISQYCKLYTYPDQTSVKPMCVHETATEEKCDGRWAYLSSYLYHQPLPESQKSRKIRPDRDLREAKPSTWATCTCPNLGPSAKYLVRAWEKVNIWFISVVRRTYRDIYITSSVQNLKNHKNLPDRDLREAKPSTWATSTCPNLGPSAKYLVRTWEKVNIWFISVVR